MRTSRRVIYVRWSVGFGWFVSYNRGVVLKWGRARIVFRVAEEIRIGMGDRFINFISCTRLGKQQMLFSIGGQLTVVDVS